MAGTNCEQCKFRAKYDRNPQSLLGRLWHWHVGWCPGWKRYVKSLTDTERTRILEKYNLDGTRRN